MRVKVPVSSSILQRPRSFLYTAEEGQIPGKGPIENMLFLNLGDTFRSIGCLDRSFLVSVVWQRPVPLGNTRRWYQPGVYLSGKAGSREVQ